jgi:hypothetical protein
MRREAKKEARRVVSREQHDELLSSFRLFRGDNRDKKKQSASPLWEYLFSSFRFQC